MKVDDNKLKNDLISGAAYWKKMAESAGYNKAIVILANRDINVNLRTLHFIPALIVRKRYDGVHVVSDSRETIELAETNLEIEASFFVCEACYIDLFCKIVSLTGLFSEFYINITKDIDDADPCRLIGYENITPDDIIARVFFQLEYTPSDDEINGYRKKIVTDQSNNYHAGTKIDWIENRNWIPFEKNNYPDLKQFLYSIKRKLERGGYIDKNSDLVLYGDSLTAKECIAVFSDYKIKCIADRNIEKKGNVINGISILSPDEVFSSYNGNIRVLVAIYHFRDVCEWLADRGYRLGKSVFILNYKDNTADMSEEIFRSEIEDRLEAGKRVYEKIRSDNPDSLLLLSPWVATGDIYIDGLYLREYIDKNGISDSRIIVSSSAAGKIAGLFRFDPVVISGEEAFALLDYGRAAGFEETHMLNINVNVGKQRVGELGRNVDFNTFHQRLVFQFEEKRFIPDMVQNSSDAIIKENDLEIGRTALIAPYSGTLGRIDEKLCTRIVKMLKEMGYIVCTNTGKSEEALPETLGLYIPYDRILDFVNKAGVFIGIRSGLCDIVSATSSKMIIFYPRGKYNYFSLQRMGLKTTGILELNADEETEDEAIRKIDLFIHG